MKTSFLRTTFLLFAVSVIRFSTQAQTNPPEAHLSGRLTDLSGYGVGKVKVTAQLESAANSQVWSTASAADGTYLLTVPPGRYRIHFQHPSFAARDFTLDLTAGENRTLDPRLEIERLSDNVVVTANAEPLESSRTAAPVDEITREQISQRQSVTLPDLLYTQPGISVARTGPIGGLATIFLDGGNSNYTKVLVDGVPVNDPGGFISFSNFTLDNVDKVEIVHGAESALYGSDAMSGVIQLFSHQGTTRTPSFDLFAEGGGFSSARGGAQVSGLLGAFDYSASGSYFQTDGQGQNDAFLNRSFSGNLGYKFSDADHLRLTVRSNSSFAGTPGPTLQGPGNATPLATDALHILSAGLSWDFRTGSHWEHRLMGTETRILDVSADPPFFTFVDQLNRAGFQEQSTFYYRQGLVAAGYSNEVENGFPGTLHAHRDNQAGFLDARYQPHRRVTLNAGVRAEANGSFGTRVVPRAGAVLVLRYGKGLWGDTRFRTSYGQGIKEPGLEQSFATDPCDPGNPALRPERSRTYYAGFEQLLDSDKIRISADYFTNRFHDVISFAFLSTLPPGCSFGGTYFNTDLARARGVNFSMESRPFHWLAIRGNYSYDDTRVLKSANPFADPALEPGNPLLRRPLNSGALNVNVGWRRMNWNFSGYFTGRRTDSNFANPTQFENPGYARFDLATSYLIARGISFTGRVANLFDKQYQDALGFPALGRDFRLGLNYRFTGRD
jgi:outer membrane cobalamin receptor